MSETLLTSEQAAALAADQRSVSLAAGAGCGKTFVLTERYLREVDPTAADAADVDEVVAITFTDAAAREMRERIRRRCRERIRYCADDDSAAAAWRRLLRQLDRARISTVHSFCTEFLRRHAVEAGLDPQFVVLDAPAATLLRWEVIDAAVREWLQQQREEVLELAAESGLGRLRADLSNFCAPHLESQLAAWNKTTPEELTTLWRTRWLEDLLPPLRAAVFDDPAYAELRAACQPGLATDAKLQGRLAEIEAALAALGEAPPADAPAAAAALKQATYLNDLRGAKKWIDPSGYGRLRDAVMALRPALEGLAKLRFDEEASLLEATRALALTRLAGDVLERIQAAKAERRQLEFDDLILRAGALLTDPEQAAVREAAARRVRLVMVDEFQDTNPRQLALVQALCGPAWRERGLFVVGDFKQSIYAFNGAEPEVSLSLRQELAPQSRLSLTRNFRSQQPILDFVNGVFAEVFPQYEPLAAHRPRLATGPAVEFLWTAAESSADDTATSPDDDDSGDGSGDGSGSTSPKLGADEQRRREARSIARRLRELLDAGEPLILEGDQGGPRLRPSRAGDVAILLRSLSDVQYYEEALRQFDLPYHLAGGHAFYAQQEIFDVLNLLQSIVGAADEIALAGALRSPLFGLRDETLYWLKNRYGSLHGAIAAAQDLPDVAPDEAARAAQAAATLERLRREKDRLSTADLLLRAWELTGYDAVVECEFLGPRKRANLDKLVEQARRHDRLSPGDLAGFVTQLSELVANTPKEALAATQAEGDVVRLMTFHHAKGLEFPIVVLPDLERRRRATTQVATIDARWGPVVKVTHDEGTGTTGAKLLLQQLDVRDRQERARLLYVACTRAADYLILSSWLVDPDAPKQDWLQAVRRRCDLADGSRRAAGHEGLAWPAIRVTRSDGAPPAAAASDRGPDLVETLDRALREDAIPAPTPATASAVPPRGAARRRYSFSRLSGLLAAAGEPVVAGDDDAAPAGSLAWESDLPAPGGDPRPDAELGSGGRARGLLVHKLLEHLDFRRPARVGEVAQRLASHCPVSALPHLDEAVALVERFLTSPRAKELADAVVIEREVEYLLPWPPAADASGGRPRYLHGYLDCLYQDRQGGWRLIDFKTNRIAAARVAATARQYELQMLAYRLAAEGALGNPLQESTLLFLEPGQDFPWSWSDDAQRQAERAITAAMDELDRRTASAGAAAPREITYRLQGSSRDRGRRSPRGRSGLTPSG